jgi:hypothetical protein
MEISKEYNQVKENIKKSKQGVKILEEIKRNREVFLQLKRKCLWIF